MLVNNTHFRNFSIHDIHTKVNTRLLLPDYHKLTYPYRFSTLIRYIDRNTIEKLPKVGNYPEFTPLKETGSEEMVLKSLQFFIDETNIPKNATLRVDACRYLHDSYVNTEWYSENYNIKGIFCLNQDGLEEGTFQLRKKKQDHSHEFYWKIKPGEMLIVQDGSEVLQKFKTYAVQENGYLDFLMFVY